MVPFSIIFVGEFCVTIYTNEGNSRTTERTYKYGNSDTYKGSSQQAADLAAIDRYGANNPDFW